MIDVSILYPNDEGCRFDFDYYCQRHMPMVVAKLGGACSRFTVEKGLGGGVPGQPAAYVAIGHLYCESAEAFGAAFAPHARAIAADIPNYTDSTPLIQVSEVLVA